MVPLTPKFWPKPRELGYAEADPTMDVDGADATQKLAILAHLAFGARVDWQDIPRTGIDTLDVADVRYAQEMGYKIKLLAVAQLVGDGLELHVSPTLVKRARRSPRWAGRSTQFGLWAMPWDRCCSTVQVPDKCRLLRPSSPT